MARTYKRDSRGRFAGGGGGGGGRPAARKAPRGTNRLTRDNAGKITGTGNGATARGGRLKTASGKQRGKVVATMKGAGGRLRKPAGAKAGAPKTRGEAVNQFKKVDTGLSGIKTRKKRALTPKNSTYLSSKKEIKSAIIRSAANAIYNRQLRTGKELGTSPAVVRQPIGIMPGLSGSNRNRALANLENARKRVIKGRKGRR